MTNGFVKYWAAARLFVSGGNPYSPAELVRIQQTAGWSAPMPLLLVPEIYSYYDQMISNAGIIRPLEWAVQVWEPFSRSFSKSAACGRAPA
jgi:hypothetical protein